MEFILALLKTPLLFVYGIVEHSTHSRRDINHLFFKQIILI